jgi:phosphatidylglycerol:prolipoprotein diacylglycerol transferase
VHPELFHIGNFVIPISGFAFCLSLIIFIVLSYRRGKLEEINDERHLAAMLLGITGLVVFSKAFHILTSWDWYAEHPRQIFDLRSGYGINGGYIGGVLLPFIYIKLVKERYLPLLDIWLTYAILGFAIHKAIGCLGAGCCYGKPTGLPWGITFPASAPASRLYGQVPVHPTQLYEAALALFSFLFLLYWRKHRRKIAGELFAWQLGLFTAGRFITEFYRGDTGRGFLGPLSVSQWISIIAIGLVGIMIIYILRKRKELARAVFKHSGSG